MIETIPFDQICIPVTESSQPAAARRAAVALAQDADLDETTVGHLALVVTELATNLVKHAKGGELLMRRLGAEGAGRHRSAVAGQRARDFQCRPVARRRLFDCRNARERDWVLSLRRAGAFDLYSQPARARR